MVRSGAKSSLMEKVQTALISIGTTAVVGCCTFLFKVNGSLERIEQSLFDEVRIRNEQQAKINTIELKVADLEIAKARIETKQNLKPR
jgi:phosphoribosylpyrophosphate synthetase